MRKDEIVTWGRGEGIKVRHRAHDCNYGCRLLLFFFFFERERERNDLARRSPLGREGRRDVHFPRERKKSAAGQHPKQKQKKKMQTDIT